jgi:CheY-like chemotaxis protein
MDMVHVYFADLLAGCRLVTRNSSGRRARQPQQTSLLRQKSEIKPVFWPMWFAPARRNIHGNQSCFGLQNGIMTIKLLLVDDQPRVRRGLRMSLALEKDFQVSGEAGDGEAALALAATLAPDVVVMDVAMPGMDGIAATQALRAAVPRAAVIILSLHDDALSREQAVKAGAAAFISKHAPLEELIAAIRLVVEHKD